MSMEDDSVINVKAGKFVHASSPNMLHENNESFQTRPIFLPMHLYSTGGLTCEWRFHGNE